MARPQTIDDEDLLARLAEVFRDVGYAAASLSDLSAASGLQRASLYHRFPGGKEQMAQEVLAAALARFSEKILAPLAGGGTPAARLKIAAANLDKYYASGRKSCLLNLFAAPGVEGGPFAPAIKSAFEALIAAFAALAREDGRSAAQARRRAARAVMLLQGSLVLSRGLGKSDPFKSVLADLPEDLLGE
ncbi:MAG: hypothetical protein A3E78_07155 [Alphaproteobacteria bacterium RIFCSPHIGHO2_12_FULL_63_12]|nr:MAG: hypothetical protein A3E78_07155 [Alphaproteobacteria bacterium RIFCSPHIGHO2_12_FULL_63_12]